MFQLMPIARFCAHIEDFPRSSPDPICTVPRQGLPLTTLAVTLCDLMRKAVHNHTLEENLL
jgi:hypothetical protein